MRADIFQDRKCIHIKLDKDVHAALRARLFRHGLSMQEIFDEFAKQFVTDDSKATKIVEQLVMRKTKEAIEGREERKRRRDRSVNELDHETLYSLIEEKNEQDESV